MCFDGGHNLPLNHAITVINLLSALIPVPRCNLLPERQRARLENKRAKKNQKARGETEIGVCVFEGSGDSVLLLRLVSEWVLYTMLPQNEEHKLLKEKKGSSNTQ